MGGERTAILSHPAGCFFFCTLIVRLIGLVANGKFGILCHVILGKTEKLRQIFGHISQRQHRICGYVPHCRPPVFNLNINRKSSPLPAFLPAEGCVFILLPTTYSAAYRGAANIYNSDHLFSRISESDKHFAVMSSPFYQVFKLNICC